MSADGHGVDLEQHPEQDGEPIGVVVHDVGAQAGDLVAEVVGHDAALDGVEVGEGAAGADPGAAERGVAAVDRGDDVREGDGVRWPVEQVAAAGAGRE